MLNARLLLPDVESLSPNCAIRICSQQVAAWVEVAMDKRMRGKKALSQLPRFESLHLAFSTSCRTMRVLRAIVQIAALSMLNLRKELPARHTVASQLIGHDHAWLILEDFQQPSKKAFGRIGIPPWLNENVEHDAVLVHGAPEIVLHSLDPDEHLIHVPLVPRSWPAAAQAICECLAKLLAPPTNRLIRDDNATFSQKQLNITQTEAEHVVQPHSMADDLGGKAVAVVRVRRELHAASLAGLQRTCQTQLP
jgi:hypothetical protein